MNFAFENIHKSILCTYKKRFYVDMMIFSKKKNHHINIKLLFKRTQDRFMNVFSTQNPYKFDLRVKDRIFYGPFLQGLNHHVNIELLWMRTKDGFMNVLAKKMHKSLICGSKIEHSME